MASFSDSQPYLKMGGKIDPLTEIRNLGIVTSGSVLWVKKTADDNYTTFADQVGASVIRNTVQGAIDLCRTDKNDYVLVVPGDGGTAYALGTAIDVNEDRIHLLGVGANHAHHGYALTFEGYVSANGIDTELMKVTGAGCELGGFRLLGTSGTAAGGTLSGGFLNFGTASSGTPHDTYVHDVTVENTQSAAAGGTTDLVTFTGDVGTGIRGVTFDNVWMGNWSWVPAACVRMTGTAGPTRTEFHDCTFVIDAQDATDSFIVLGTGAMEYTSFERCKFINVEAGTAPASAVEGALLVDNPVVLIDCTGVNVTAFGTDTELLIVPNQSGTAGAGVRNPRIGFIGTAGIVAA